MSETDTTASVEPMSGTGADSLVCCDVGGAGVDQREGLLPSGRVNRGAEAADRHRQIQQEQASALLSDLHQSRQSGRQSALC
eukprot:799594-Rhodomonas_salina.1